MKITAFTEENVAHAVQLGRELVAAGTFGVTGPAFDWDFTLATTKHLMGLDSYYLRLAYDDANVPCGFVAGHVNSFYFSPKLLAAEDAWFVRPDTRGRTKIAVALMRGFVSWSLDVRGALLVQTGDIASIDTVAVDSLYKHMGFKRFGTVYKYSRDVGEA